MTRHDIKREKVVGHKNKCFKIPKSMFGSLRGKIKAFTAKERKEIWHDAERIT